jgi:hypothetical protein
MIMIVRVYQHGKLQGERRCFDATEVADAVGSVMAEQRLGHCAARFEDLSGSGGWMIVGDPTGKTSFEDMPRS